MTTSIDTAGPLFGGAPTWHMLDLIKPRLNGAGILYVSIDRVREVYPHWPERPMRSHTDTAMAVVRATSEVTSHQNGRKYRTSRKLHRHFAAPCSEFNAYPWVIDNREISWPETTTSIVAKDMTRFAGGLTSSPKKTRLWFPDLASCLFACAWPWADEWSASNLHRALMDQRIEVVADYLQHAGLVDLGTALMLWEHHDRAEAAVALFRAAKPIRQAARKLATQQRVESEVHAKAHYVWAYHDDRRGDEPVYVESERIHELRAELLAFGAGVPLPQARAA